MNYELLNERSRKHINRNLKMRNNHKRMPSRKSGPDDFASERSEMEEVRSIKTDTGTEKL